MKQIFLFFLFFLFLTNSYANHSICKKAIRHLNSLKSQCNNNVGCIGAHNTWLDSAIRSYYDAEKSRKAGGSHQFGSSCSAFLSYKKQSW